jgi:hypothetical protein
MGVLMLPAAGLAGRSIASASRGCRGVLCALVLFVLSHVAAAAAPVASPGRAALVLGLSDDGQMLRLDANAEEAPLPVDPRINSQVEALCHRRSDRALVERTEARILSRAEARWPSDLAADGGCAVFTFRIDPEGRAVDIRTVSFSPSRALSRSLRQALSDYRFAPGADGQEERGSLVLSLWLAP